MKDIMKSRHNPAMPFPIISQSYHHNPILKSPSTAVIKPVKIEQLMAQKNDGISGNKYACDPPGREESRTEQYRKYMKPLLERKRRARINKCLDELKDIMLNVVSNSHKHHQNSLESKLEKADILEVTVNYLKTLKHTNNLVLNENHIENENSRRLYQIGYQACGEDMTQFLSGVAANQPSSQTAADNLVKSVIAASFQNNATGTFTNSQNEPKFMLNSEPKLSNNNYDLKFSTAGGGAAVDLTLTNQDEGGQCNNIKREASWRPW